MSSTYGWIITWGNPEIGLDDAEGIRGPHDMPLINELDMPQATLSDLIEFKMFDDDGEHYYTGRLWLDDERTDVWTEAEEEEAFGPLYDFGQPDSGCTEIRYKLNNQWKTI